MVYDLKQLCINLKKKCTFAFQKTIYRIQLVRTIRELSIIQYDISGR